MSQIITPKTTQPTSNNINNNNNNNNHHHRSKVWVYFKQCDDDTTKFRCNLCSTELRNTRGTTTILWNHVKFKHSIERNSTATVATSNNNTSKINRNINSTATSTTLATKTTNTILQRDHILNNEEELRGDKLFPTATRIRSTATPAMVHTKFEDLNSNNTKKLKFKQNLEYVDFNELTDNLTSMKPLPSTSLSKNLISRLNQLSLPVTRKLKFWNKKSFQVNQYDPSFKVIYLGNLGMHLWSKDESCLDKPLSTLWNNYLVNMKTEIVMRLTICNSGLKAITRQHGLTQYWSNRLVYCCSHKNYPRVFSWVYRHEGKKMRQELRCHAVFCPSPEKAAKMVIMLNQRLTCALQEFRREKKSRGFSLVSDNMSPSSLMHNKLPRTIPLRRQILEKGSANFRPPLERSKSAPKLTSILEEDYDLEEESEEDEEVTHEEFEYEESFLDREDDESDYQDHLNNEDEEDSVNKLESDSMTTTLNEELSNSSSTGATGDSKQSNHTTQNQQNDNSRMKHNPLASVEQINDRLAKSIVTNDESIKESNCTSCYDGQSEGTQENSHYQNKLSDNEKELILINKGHRQINNQNENDSTSSANTKTTISTTSSSSKLIQVTDTSREKLDFCSIDEEENKPSSKKAAKNNNISNHMNQQQSPVSQSADANDDDSTTQEIMLSWSNLVIK